MGKFHAAHIFRNALRCTQQLGHSVRVHHLLLITYLFISGAFRVEMQRENQKDRTILCKFDPTEPGDYRVEVKWAGEHVPGSPFMVMIFDTQEELNRFLQVNC